MKTVYYGGDILTMENGPMPEAVLVTDGRIARLGSREELCSEPDVQLVDLKGHALLPAFIDPHSHIMAVARTLGMVDLSDAASFAEIQQKLRQYWEQEHPAPGEWVIGFGYDHNNLAEQAHPDREVLDAVSDQNPVLISHASGHMGVTNSAGLKALGVTAQTTDPEGGRIGRLANGEPSGFLEETAFIARTAQIPLPPEERLLERISRAEDIYFRHGITTIQEGVCGRSEWTLLLKMAEQKRLRADVVCYADMVQHAALLAEYPEYVNQYRNRLKLGGYKIYLDGSPQGRTAWMTEPYEGEAEYRGYPVHSGEKVAGFLKKALREEAQLLAHCNGDAAAEQYLSCMEEAVLETGRRPVRPVMIHAQLVRPDQLSRMTELGMFASFFTAHSWYWGDVHLKNFGRARAEKISPARSAMERGTAFTFHQDSPVIPPDMIETVWCAVNRVTKNGVSLDGGEKIPVLEALKAVTISAAAQYGEQAEKGSIREGKRADFVILSENPLQVPQDELKRIRVEETIREGETVYRSNAAK